MAKRREKGDGSIYQRASDKMYVAYARLPSGKKKYLYAKTRAEVSKKLKALQRQIEQGTLVTAKPESVEAYLRYWLDIHKGRVKASTIVSYSNHLQRVYLYIGKIKLQKLTADQLQRMYHAFQQNGLLPSTIRLVHRILNAAFRDAVRWKRLASNPCSDAVLAKAEKHKAIVLAPEQAQQLLNVAHDSNLECFLTVALCTCMRRGELLGLKWSDINLEERYLKVNRTVGKLPDASGKYRMVESTPKSEAGNRPIALASIAVEALKAHRRRQNELRLAAGAKWQDRDLVFPGRYGQHHDIKMLTRAFKKLLAEAGLPDMRIHDLRHSAATLLLKMGVPAKVVQEILGHSSIVITQDIYGHVLPEMQSEAMAKWDQLFRKEG